MAKPKNTPLIKKGSSSSLNSQSKLLKSAIKRKSNNSLETNESGSSSNDSGSANAKRSKEEPQTTEPLGALAGLGDYSSSEEES